jgi:spore coat protein U-like protein
MGNPGGVNFGNLERPNLTADVEVSFYCNVPFTISLKAEHGALTNEREPNGEGPYAGSLPYTLGLTVPVNLPGSSLLQGNFGSGALAGGQSLSSGGGIALNGFDLHVALGAPASDAGLVAGHYSETIVITVAPS